jgi:predicted flavoprotein YhiN
MGRKNRRVYVDVEVNLDEFDESDLIEYLKESGYAVIKGDGGKGFDLDALREIYECVQRNQRADALTLLERLIWPKWKTPADCQKALDLATSKAA